MDIPIPDLNAPVSPALKARQMQQNIALPLPDLAPIGGMMNSPLPAIPPIPLPVAPTAAQNKYAYLTSTGSGIDQMDGQGFGHGLLKGLARTADIAGQIFAPGLERRIPGTAGYHEDEVARAGANLDREQQMQMQQAQLAHTQAQTANENAQPELKQQANDLAQSKLDAQTQHQQDVLDQQKQLKTMDDRQKLAAHGYALDESDSTGQKLRPLRYEEMSESQQAVHDLKNAQQEQTDAQAALNRAKNDPSSPAYQQANARIQVARQNAQTAAGRLGLAGAQYEMRAYGTHNGVALPGSMQDDNGNPIGTAFQGNVRPTGTERNKADMAGSASEQLQTLSSIVHSHPEVFGPVNGRTTDFNVWLGSQSPDAQRFRAARTIAGDHLAGTFGGRSEAALNAIDNVIGQFKDNPAAMEAGIDQLTKANGRFLNAGTVRTNGSKAGNAAAPAPKGYVSLQDAMSLPQNKGKSQQAVTQDLRAHGYEVR